MRVVCKVCDRSGNEQVLYKLRMMTHHAQRVQINEIFFLLYIRWPEIFVPHESSKSKDSYNCITAFGFVTDEMKDLVISVDDITTKSPTETSRLKAHARIAYDEFRNVIANKLG